MLDLRRLVELEKEVVSTLERVCAGLEGVFGHSSEGEGSYGLDGSEDFAHSRN